MGGCVCYTGVFLHQRTHLRHTRCMLCTYVYMYISVNMHVYAYGCVIQINLFSVMCALFYSSFVCISAYANVYFKTTIIKQNIKVLLPKEN